ncbi:1-aminocyclopropane-1-carboxylate deaminase [Bradyrhizobium sp. LM2.7]
MLEKFARYPLTFGPTPIEKLERLSKHLGGNVEIYAKREDCNSGLAYGGNKLRKLEYIIPDAIASNADTLVSIGGVQSNHTRMVAAVAAKIGMKCRLVQEAWVPHEDAVYDRVGNIMLSRIMGADVRLVDDGFDIGIRKSWEEAIEEVKAAGGKPYAIPAGASVHKFGGLGYVAFAEEVRKQEAELGFKFDYVVVCTVTGSTHAGMLVGFAADGRARKVIGIDASFTPAQTKAQVLSIAQNTAKLVELGKGLVADDVVLIEDYAYPAYGVPSEETKEAIRLTARLEAMITDPVYEGKSMQGLIDLTQEGIFREGRKDPLRPSRRCARTERLWLYVPERVSEGVNCASPPLSSWRKPGPITPMASCRDVLERPARTFPTGCGYGSRICAPLRRACPG